MKQEKEDTQIENLESTSEYSSRKKLETCVENMEQKLEKKRIRNDLIQFAISISFAIFLIIIFLLQI